MDAVYATHDHGLLLTMMEQSEEITGAKAAVTLADSGYFAGSDLEECIQRGQHRVWMESGEGMEMHKRRQRLAGPVFRNHQGVTGSSAVPVAWPCQGVGRMDGVGQRRQPAHPLVGVELPVPALC